MSIFFVIGSVQANGFILDGNRGFNLDVKSFREQRFKDVIPQHYDFSCGAAALATLLQYHYDYPVTEQQVLDVMFNAGDKEKIRKQGFSLLDMKNYLQNIGLPADGYRVDMKKIEGAGIPGIVLINSNGYLHFVVIKGVSDTHVLVGDPALGMRKITKEEFAGMWNNIYFIIKNNMDIAQTNFKMADTGWERRKETLFNNALSDQALGYFTIHTSLTPNIYQGF